MTRKSGFSTSPLSRKKKSGEVPRHLSSFYLAERWRGSGEVVARWRSRPILAALRGNKTEGNPRTRAHARGWITAASLLAILLGYQCRNLSKGVVRQPITRSNPVIFACRQHIATWDRAFWAGLSPGDRQSALREWGPRCQGKRIVTPHGTRHPQGSRAKVWTSANAVRPCITILKNKKKQYLGITRPRAAHPEVARGNHLRHQIRIRVRVWSG